jgi:putative protease
MNESARTNDLPSAIAHRPVTALNAPELLAPAGDRDCVRAAIENGADAVYFGLDCGFNARARATNFSLDTLPEVLAQLHQRGVKGYVTLNTLVFPSELADVEQTIRCIAEAGVDAVLVQDLGVVRLIRALCPDLPIHASTQMTLTSAECIRAAELLGVERVVLARELSIKEIRKIARQTTMPLEVFVHGALCVAYSGQCLTSESLGGRSANRGQCAQACRLPYDLTCDGQDVDLGNMKYLLSPQDLAAFELVPELIEASVCSFKIEGRLKTPEYVANITRHYRQAIDTAMAGRPVQFTRREVEEMELSFSRGFSPGWLGGCDHKMLVPALSSAKRGVLLGEVTAVRGQRVAVQLAASVSRGDGIVFDGDRANNDEQGGRVYEVFSMQRPVDEPISTGIVELAFQHGAIDMERLWVGQQIWKTDDPRLTGRLRKTFSGPDAHRRVSLDLEVHAAVGQPLCIVGRADSGAACRVESSQPLEAAVRHPLSQELLEKQLGRLGGTVYQLRSVTANIIGQPMVPLSVLGQLRHEMVRQLEASIANPPPRRIATDSALAALRATLTVGWVFNPSIDPANPSSTQHVELKTDGLKTHPTDDDPPSLRVLCRSLHQLQEVIGCDVDSVMVDFQDIRQYRDAVRIARESGVEIYLATPRIQKPDELGIFRVLLRHNADGILVRNLGGLRYYAERGTPSVADFSLNATNELTVQYLREQGARRITASYDLNRDQLLDLVSATPPAWLEVVVHQHMPMFHMEHCVFCAVLSPGTNKTNCGRPCDRHEVRLRDRLGMEHPLKADVGCRNTLLNAVPQSAAEIVPTLLSHGLREFRIELLDESGDQLRTVINSYRDLLSARVTGKEVWTRLNAANRVGVTRGTLEERRNPLAII